MIGMVEFATHDDAGLDGIAGEFAREMALGLVVGVAGGFALLWLLRRIALPDAPLYPLAVLGFAGVVYGAGGRRSTARGSSPSSSPAS